MARVTCECGDCHKCKRRVYMRQWYRRPGNAEKARERVTAYREANIEVVRAKDRERGFRLYDPVKQRARRAVNHALETGRMVREACEKCGAAKAQAHHDDYSKPLVVRWLCSVCHGIEHRTVVS